MSLISNIAKVVYYIIWTIFIVLAYAFLSDIYYISGRMFAPLFGVIALVLLIGWLVILLILFFIRREGQKNIVKSIIQCLSPCIFLIPFMILYLRPNPLEAELRTIKVSYVDWGCDCAKWALKKDNKIIFSGDPLNLESIYLEQAKGLIPLPDTIGYGGDILILTGRFYSRKGFPINYQTQEFPDKARVFQYNEFKVIRSNYEPVSVHPGKE